MGRRKGSAALGLSGLGARLAATSSTYTCGPPQLQQRSGINQASVYCRGPGAGLGQVMCYSFQDPQTGLCALIRISCGLLQEAAQEATFS